MALAAMFLALALVLPFLTLQIPLIGQLLTPMHFPIILGSIFIGPVWGLVIGFIAPLLRLFVFGMPQMPMAIIMAFELAIYGLVTGLVLRIFRKSKLTYILKIIIALMIAMILGRIVYALAAMIFLQSAEFIPVFIGTFTTSFIGILLQLILIPLIALRLKKYVQKD
jgi:predicted membrane protein